ncbi:type II toxin-antitoxin system RelB/DinJ family antitoxin [Bifidobacterium biavatii]|uniref:DNA-damage-inducible protein J n=1 Tax=Bifidobacterium biavatii DSM 23969 TaxID=1437608 RepID=A0A086ZHU4_9BIFI|nr:type II toxin-antitoxin system RelB/DinJ family antitoxin [Bifidobacterium biavatii]KFI46094.1 DNA-damage-inducible protein J [Bifidobacterium biavatii DSM 23969]
MAAPTPTSVRLDPELKRQAEEVFDQLGLTANTAITLFYKAVVRDQAIPFSVSVKPLEEYSPVVEAMLKILNEQGALSAPDAEDDGPDDDRGEECSSRDE